MASERTVLVKEIIRARAKARNLSVAELYTEERANIENNLTLTGVEKAVQLIELRKAYDAD